ncbi:MAG: ABC transporter substrate-binding protein [Alphaproteobacteria bacterium]
MRRRDLLGSAVAGAALAPFGTVAQPGLPVIGYLTSLSPEAETFVRAQAAFLGGLEKAGFVAGRNVAIEYRFARGQVDRLPMLAAELVRLPVAVLVAPEASTAVAAKKATATIPIVFTSGLDPVQLGLVASLHRPAGNATGTSSFVVHLGPKRLEMLRELLPQPRLIAALFSPTASSIQLQIREIEAAAQALGQPLLVLQARDADEVETAFARIGERQAAGLVYGASTYFQVIADKLVALAARYRLPAVYEWPEFVAAGGLMSYSTHRAETRRIVGDYVGRILKGAAPADLPVVQSSRFELVINLKTAGDLGLTIPQSLLARADEVIE